MARKSKSKVSFFYPVKTVSQLDFENRTHQVDVFLCGHIIMNEVILCGIGKDLAKSQVQATKQKLVSTRMLGVDICKDCIERYKQTRGTDWSKWASSVKNTV